MAGGPLAAAGGAAGAPAALGAFGSSLSAPVEGFAKMLGARAQPWAFLPPPGFSKPPVAPKPSPLPSQQQTQPYRGRPTPSPSPSQPLAQQQAPEVVELLDEDDDQVS
jgi:hypothetical protein